MVFLARVVRIVCLAALLFAAESGTGELVIAKVENDRILVGAVVSQTGRYATNGRHLLNGYRMAVEKVNALGGVRLARGSLPIELLVRDDESTAARGARAAEDLIVNQGVRYLLGPYGSALARAIAPIAEKHGVLFIEITRSARGQDNADYKHIVSLLPPLPKALGDAVAFVADIEGKPNGGFRVAAAGAEDKISTEIREGAVAAARKAGLPLVLDEILPFGEERMNGIISRARKLDANMLVVAGHAPLVAATIRAVVEERAGFSIVAVNDCDVAELASRFGSDANGVICPTYWHPSLAIEDQYFGSAESYSIQFETAHGYLPPFQAAAATAAVQTLVESLVRSDSGAPDKARDSLVGMPVATLFGEIRIDATGRNTGMPMPLLQIQDGAYVPVAPASLAKGRLRLRGE